MKPKSKLITFILLALLIVQSPIVSYADDNPGFQQNTIEFSSQMLSLKKIFEELDALPDLNVVYGNIDQLLNLPITFSAKTLSIKQVVEEIEDAAPVDIVFNNTHFIVKNRELERSYKLSGKVIDAKTRQGLVAANVLIGGTTSGVVTDNEGNFSFRLTPAAYQLVFRYVGYKELSVKVSLFQDRQLLIPLEVQEHEIGPVDVNGSFKLLENLETGRTIETLDSKIIDKVTTNNVTDALHGRINGVWSTKVSGAPGDHMKIRIRGISSIFGSTDPIFVVDGSMIPIVNFDNLGIADLNTHDVESITILKDASSTAMYGNLGGNGVILIETKRGGGKPSFNFQVKQGFQRFDKRYDLMGAEDFFSTLHKADDLIGTEFYTENPYAHPPKYPLYPEYLDSLGNPLAERNYQNELFRLGSIREVQLSGSGSLKSIDYYLSGNYYNHDGVVVNSNYNKITFTANVSKSFGEKLSLRVLYKGSQQENTNTLDNYMGNNIILKGINYEPAYLATPDSFFTKRDRLFYNVNSVGSAQVLSRYNLSPGQLFYDLNKIKRDVANTINLQGVYKINANLIFRGNLSMAFRKQAYSTNLEPAKSKVDSSLYYPGVSSGNYVLQSTEHYIYFTQQYNLNYSRQLKNHGINAVLQYRNYKDNVYWAVDSTNVYDFKFITRDDDLFIRGSQVLYGTEGSVLRSINSLIFNGNYNFKNKYFVSVMANMENLHEGEYVSHNTLFSSIAINYNLAAEPKLPLPDWINKWNVYMNWGQSGNYPLNSLSNDLFENSTRYVKTDSIVSGVYVSNLANYELKPESVTETNFGTDISLLDDRIIINADYYRKVNDDLLIKRTIPYYYGGGFFFQNVGQMKNSGIELSLELIPFDNPNTYWSTKFSFSTNHQYITRLDDGADINFNYLDILVPDFVAKENEILGSIYGYKYLGLWKDFYDPQYGRDHPDYVEDHGLAYARKDLLINAAIKETDKTVIGNSLPDFTCNWINTFEYKNWSMEMFWYGVVGVDKYNATKASTFMTGLNSEVRNIILDTMYYHSNQVFYESSYFVEDASFLRLKTLSITYRQPKKIAHELKLEYTLNFENLVTLTKYSGYDPEAAIYTNNNFTDNAIDKGAYPNPRGVYLSIKLTY